MKGQALKFFKRTGKLIPLLCSALILVIATGTLLSVIHQRAGDIFIGSAYAEPYSIIKVDDHYVSGPSPEGSGDPDAIIQADPRFTPFAVPFLVKQLPVTIKGTVQGTMKKCPYPRLMGFFSTKIKNAVDLKPPMAPMPETKPGEMPKMAFEQELDLGGTVTVYLGEEMEQHTFDAPTLIYIPANVPHGVIVYGQDINSPIMFVDTFPEGRTGQEVALSNLMEKLPDFKQGFPDKATNPTSGNPPWNSAGGGKYGKYFFSGSRPDAVSLLPASQLRLLPGDIPDLPLEKSILFIYTTEAPQFFENRPLHIPHAHPFDEYLAFFSTDANDPHNLGMEAHIYAFNSETHMLERRIFEKPFLSIMRRSKDLHTPLVHRKMKRKTGFIWMAINYDPAVFRDTGNPGTPDFIPAARYGLSMQLHNEYYTKGRFNSLQHGVLPQDLPEGVEGDGGFLLKMEPHCAYSCTTCHGSLIPELP